jgi:hypothetical protein
MVEKEKPGEQPANLLWALDEIIMALQRFREQLKLLAAVRERHLLVPEK